MDKLADDYMEMLKRELKSNYVPLLPPLIPNKQSAKDQEDKQLSRAFSAFVLHKKLDVSPKVAARSIVDDFNDNGVDAIYYHDKSETLYFVQTKLKASEEFKQAEAQAFCSGARLLIQQNLSTFNDHLQKIIVDVEDAFGTCSHIKLIVAFTGHGISQHAITTLEQFLGDDSLDEERLSGPIEYFTPNEVKTSLLEAQSYKKVNADIYLSNHGKILEPRQTYYGQIKVKDLIDLHVLHKKALYEKNIRYFLGSSKSDVNRSIQKTLIEDQESFFYLNNGITALCDHVDPKNTKCGIRKLKVFGLSIVNGAQTVASSAEALSTTPSLDLANAKVMFTLIQAKSDGSFGTKVTRARNHQNPVSTANFAALDPQQERLRQEMACFGIYYHYRPEAAVRPDSNNILLSEAIPALYWLNQDPRYTVWLKSSSTSIYDAGSAHYQGIFSSTLKATSLANAVFYMREIQNLLRSADIGSHGTERLVYRHGINVIGSVLLKRLKNKIEIDSPIDPLQISQLISRPFDEVRQQAADKFTSTVSGKGPLAFFRNQGDTLPYLSSLMIKNYNLAPHPAIIALSAPKHDDLYPQSRLFSFLALQAPQI